MSSSPRRGKQPVASRSDGAGASAQSTTAAPAEQLSAPKPSLSRWGLALLIGLALLAVLIVLSGAVGSRMFSFEKALDGAGIGYERYEDTGAHIVRWGRMQQDIDSLLNHFAKGA